VYNDWGVVCDNVINGTSDPVSANKVATVACREVRSKA